MNFLFEAKPAIDIPETFILAEKSPLALKRSRLPKRVPISAEQEISFKDIEITDMDRKTKRDNMNRFGKTESRKIIRRYLRGTPMGINAPRTVRLNIVLFNEISTVMKINDIKTFRGLRNFVEGKKKIIEDLRRSVFDETSTLTKKEGVQKLNVILRDLEANNISPFLYKVLGLDFGNISEFVVQTNLDELAEFTPISWQYLNEFLIKYRGINPKISQKLFLKMKNEAERIVEIDKKIKDEKANQIAKQKKINDIIAKLKSPKTIRMFILILVIVGVVTGLTAGSIIAISEAIKARKKALQKKSK